MTERNEGRRLAELRRSNAAGPHKDRRPRIARETVARETDEELRAISYAEDLENYGLRDWRNP